MLKEPRNLQWDAGHSTEQNLVAECTDIESDMHWVIVGPSAHILVTLYYTFDCNVWLAQRNIHYGSCQIECSKEISFSQNRHFG
jgi:hypothetical protein